MAWGGRGNRGIDDIVQRLKQNDQALKSLHVFTGRKFGPEVSFVAIHPWHWHASGLRTSTLTQEVQQLCTALEGNTVLQELYASGHHLMPQTAGMLGAMLATNASLVSICVGDDALGDTVSSSMLPILLQCSLSGATQHVAARACASRQMSLKVKGNHHACCLSAGCQGASQKSFPEQNFAKAGS